MAVRCTSEREDHHSRVAVHADVESRGFKRLRRTQCDGGRVGSTDGTMSEDRRLFVSLAHDLEFDGDIPSTVREVDATMHDGSHSGPQEQVMFTVPARSGAVRRLVLVRNSEHVHNTVRVIDLTMLDSESDRGSQNSAPSPHVPVGNDEAPISEVG